MNIINKSKLDCIINTIIKKRLINLLKYRWLIESKEEWKNNSQFSLKLIQSCGGIEKLLSASSISNAAEIDDIESGKLHLFPISFLIEILINSKYKQLKLNQDENNKLNYQNQLIKSISEIIKSTTSSFQIEELKFNEYFNKFKEFLISFDNTTTTIESIENEINNKFNNHKLSIIKLSKQDKKLNFNQEIGLLIKERGNIEFKKNNFKYSTDIYHEALEMDGISDNLKSKLYLNTSKAYYEYSISLVSISKETRRLGYPKRGEDSEILQVSLYNSLQSIIYSPNWSNSYFTTGKIYSRLGDYNKSNNYFKSALLLLSSENNNDEDDENKEKSILIINKFINENNKKLKLISNSKIKSNERDFQNEAINKLLEIGDCLKDKFGNLKITDKWLLSNFNKDDLLGFPKIFGSNENNNLAKKRGNEKVVLSKADLYDLNSKQTEKANLFYSYCVGNDSEWAQPYLKLFDNLKNKDSNNNDLLLSLLLKASLKGPILKFNYNIPKSQKEVQEYITNNIQVIQVYAELGKIYYHGYLNQDYDHEKAFYYFQLAVNHHDGLYSEHTNFAFFSLGLMYALGQTPQKKQNLEKAREIWKKGQSVGDKTCFEYLTNYNDKTLKSLSSTLSTTTTSTSTASVSQTSSIKKVDKQQSSNDRFKGVGIDILNFEINQNKQSIDTYEIKVLANKGKCDYSKLVYKTIGFVNQFLKLIENIKSIKKEITVDEMLKIIKPLSNAYKCCLQDYDAFSFIKISNNKLEVGRNLIDKLLLSNSNSTNLDVRICWLGLNRFVGNFKELFNFAKESIKYCANDNNEDDEKLIFIYYQCVFLQYQGEFKKAFELSRSTYQNLDFNSGTDETNNSRDAFIYISTSIGKYLNENEILESGSIENEFEWLEQSTLNESKIGDPHFPDIYFNFAIICSKLSIYETEQCVKLFMMYGRSLTDNIQEPYLNLFQKFESSFNFAKHYFQDILAKNRKSNQIKEKSEKTKPYQIEKKLKKKTKPNQIKLVLPFVLVSIVLYLLFIITK